MSEQYRGQIAEVPMTESWKQFQGQTVNGEFELRDYLGGSAHAAVFLTEYDHQVAAIHLISENAPGKERQLASWQLATELAHPNLIRVFQVGLSQLDSAKVFYAVTELPDENLGQILTQRALTSEETSAMLAPTLDALDYLHKRDLVHGAVSPANIGAMGDLLKLSVGNLTRAGEPTREPGNYGPPESAASSAADVWSLGMTVIEVLTQQLPSWRRDSQADPDLPAGLSEPLLGIVRNCLRRDARRRWAVSDIARHLNPAAVNEAVPSAATEPPKPPAPIAAANSEPVTARAPASPVEPPARTPVSEAPRPRVSASPSVQPSPYRKEPVRQGATSVRAKGGYFTPVIILLLLLAGFAGFKWMNRGSNSSGQTASEPSPAVSAPATSPNEDAAASQQQTPPPTATSPAKSSQTPSTPSADSPAKSQSAVDAGNAETGSPDHQVVHGVVHQVLPDVPEKAMQTIHGRFHVVVRTSTDAAGSVTDASLDSAGPSQYFANLALKAARQWKFAPAAASGSDWLIRFEFTSSGATASATPSAR